MNFDLKDFLEAASYVATIGVLVVAIIGLAQISLTKRIAKMTSKREALTLASKQVEVFLGSIINKGNDLDVEIRTKKIKVFDRSTFIMTADKISVDLKPTKKIALTEIIEVTPKLLSFLNALEGFATYFTSKLADESLAFKSIGRTYCSSVTKYMPAIATIAGKTHFKNLIELYKIWQERKDKEELMTSKQEIEKKISALDGKTIIPLGTDKN